MSKTIEFLGVTRSGLLRVRVSPHDRTVRTYIIGVSSSGILKNRFDSKGYFLRRIPDAYYDSMKPFIRDSVKGTSFLREKYTDEVLDACWEEWRSAGPGYPRAPTTDEIIKGLQEGEPWATHQWAA